MPQLPYTVMGAESALAMHDTMLKQYSFGYSTVVMYVSGTCRFFCTKMPPAPTTRDGKSKPTMALRAPRRWNSRSVALPPE